jgi:hypothetical protein
MDKNLEVRLKKALIGSSEWAILNQSKDGSFQGGHNGPWNENDTLVRTTAHYAILLHQTYLFTHNEHYKTAALKAGEYLSQSHCRPYGASFECIFGTDQRSPNGLIGQAWAIEALIELGIAYQKEAWLDLAQEIIELHPYDRHKHMWYECDIHGNSRDEMFIINQQTWFAVMVLKLGKARNNEGLLSLSTDFFSHCIEKIKISKAGLILNSSPTHFNLRSIRRILVRSKLIKVRSIGYQSFVLFAFAEAEKIQPGLIRNQNALYHLLLKAINYVDSRFPYGLGEDRNDYRWAYNPTGIEMAFAIMTLQENGNMDRWLKTQLDVYLDDDRETMIRNTDDPIILAARLYEVTRCL